MAKPWKKQWPYVTKSGEKSYRVGFRDHDGIVRTKAFPSAKIANEWTQEYVSAERRGGHSLRRFLLDLDAKDHSDDIAGQTIGEVIQLYFAFNAPETADGLSMSTFRTYRQSANRHLLGIPGMDKGKPRPAAKYAVHFAEQPAPTFNGPDAPRALRETMKHPRWDPLPARTLGASSQRCSHGPRTPSSCQRSNPTAVCSPTRRSVTGGSRCEAVMVAPQ